MNDSPTRRRIVSSTLASVAAIALLAGCAGATAEEPAADALAVNDEVQALVPEDVLEKGTISIAVDSNYPPLDSEVDGKFVGVEPELWKAAGELMGVEIDATSAQFDSIIAGLQSGRYDASFAGFWITDERVQEVDMVSFFRSGTQYLVAGDSDVEINSFDDLCGLTVALQSGSYEMNYAEEAHQNCIDKGEEDVTVQGYKTQDQANLAVQSGRADGTAMGAEVAGHIAQISDGKLKTAGEIFHEVQGGIALPQGSELSAAFQAAFTELMESGRYSEIFEEWGISSAEIETSEIFTAAR
jgi:polar amino acid transport system substrate-binding protein